MEKYSYTELGKLEMSIYGGKPRYGALAFMLVGAGAGIKDEPVSRRDER